MLKIDWCLKTGFYSIGASALPIPFFCPMCEHVVYSSRHYTVTVHRAQNTEHELCTSHDTIRAAWYQSEHVRNELILLTFTTGVRDGQGRSLVDTTLTNMDEYDPDGGLGIALYLINHGVDDEQDKARVLCEACKSRNLNVMKELVEQHNVDPNGEYITCCLMLRS